MYEHFCRRPHSVLFDLEVDNSVSIYWFKFEYFCGASHPHKINAAEVFTWSVDGWVCSYVGMSNICCTHTYMSVCVCVYLMHLHAFWSVVTACTAGKCFITYLLLILLKREKCLIHEWCSMAWMLVLWYHSSSLLWTLQADLWLCIIDCTFKVRKMECVQNYIVSYEFCQ